MNFKNQAVLKLSIAAAIIAIANSASADLPKDDSICHLKSPLNVTLNQGDKKIIVSDVKIGSSQYFDSEGNYFGPGDAKLAFPKIRSLISSGNESVPASKISDKSKSELQYVIGNECSRNAERDVAISRSMKERLKKSELSK